MRFQFPWSSRQQVFTLAIVVGAMAITSACGFGRVSQTAPARTGPPESGPPLSVTVRLAFQPGFRSQAVPALLTVADVDHVVVKVGKVADPQANPSNSRSFPDEPVPGEDGLPLQANLSRDSLDSALKFSNLRAAVTYRFKCLAYKAPGEDPADLISSQDSFRDFAFSRGGNETLPEGLPVYLLPTLFSGESRGNGIEIEAGDRVTYAAPDIYVPEPVQTDPPGTVIIPPLTEDLPDEAWEWGEEYGDE